ncbi:polysialyltransferase family glycosyltransferase [Streptomyces sp. NPDC086080]|uniref:polysialyltransferase family glycosyltransferase n=1 Tax=Streptomyces sp. NPDC086080 TaxID=3365748 RepID=UPI0037D4943B
MTRTTQIFCASTPHAVAVLAAAIGADCFAAAERRVLLVCNAAAVPEAAPAPDGIPGFASLRAPFDEVLSWNEAVRPFHPAAWTPRTEDVPLLERHLRLLWGLGEDRVELVLESPDTGWALAVAQVFTGAPLHVHAGGPAGYGPTRGKLDPLIGTRVRQVLHLDLVPGVAPLLLTEFGVPARVVPTDAFLKVVRELSAAAGALPELPDNAALLVGQSLAALGVHGAGEEDALQVRMLREAAERGHRAAVFAPHPASEVRHGGALRTEAERLGVDLTVLDSPVPAEVLFETSRPALVVGCSSTALFTASALYGLPVARVGTERLLERLTPYQNGHRVPAVLAEALLPGPEGGDGGQAPLPADELNGLVTALGFTMQPQVHPSLRPAAEHYLARHFGPGGHDGHRGQHWFRRKRLTSLGLPGGIPDRLAFLPRNATARRVVRRARALRKAVRG